MPGRPNMTRFRAVSPNRAWDARSSGPMYASTSTMRPTRRPVGVVADEPGAEQRGPRLERRAARGRPGR